MPRPPRTGTSTGARAAALAAIERVDGMLGDAARRGTLRADGADSAALAVRRWVDTAETPSASRRTLRSPRSSGRCARRASRSPAQSSRPLRRAGSPAAGSRQVLCYHSRYLPFGLRPCSGASEEDALAWSGHSCPATRRSRGAPGRQAPRVGVGYPGTPSTEVLEAFARMRRRRRAVGAEREGRARGRGRRERRRRARARHDEARRPQRRRGRAVHARVHRGRRAGSSLLVADDPGMHTSQNEQDTRNYAAFAKVPLLEPSDSPGGARLRRSGRSSISERFDTPVIVRSTIRDRAQQGTRRARRARGARDRRRTSRGPAST